MADVSKPRGRGRPRGTGRGAASRVQAPREVQNVAAVSAAPELIARRNKRHVEELERSNYAETKGADLGSGMAGNRSRTTLADECNQGRKKSTAHVRSILLYRKNLNTIIEQEGLGSLPRHVPNYLTAAAPESVIEARKLCSGARPRTRRHAVNGESFDPGSLARNDGFGFDSVREAYFRVGIEGGCQIWAYAIGPALALVGSGSPVGRVERHGHSAVSHRVNICGVWDGGQ